MDVVLLALPQEPAGGIAGWAADLVDTMGAPGAGLAIALENLFPPLPSEIILPLTGFAAGQEMLVVDGRPEAGGLVQSAARRQRPATARLAGEPPPPQRAPDHAPTP